MKIKRYKFFEELSEEELNQVREWGNTEIDDYHKYLNNKEKFNFINENKIEVDERVVWFADEIHRIVVVNKNNKKYQKLIYALFHEEDKEKRNNEYPKLKELSEMKKKLIEENLFYKHINDCLNRIRQE